MFTPGKNNDGNDKRMQKPFNVSRGNSNIPIPSINIIGASTEIEGDIRCNGDIRIDGKVKGTVSSKAKVVLGSTGIVIGDVICENADISGRVKGRVEVEQLLFLNGTSDVKGDILTGKLVVEGGASFNGVCSMGAKEIRHEVPGKTGLKKEVV